MAIQFVGNVGTNSAAYPTTFYITGLTGGIDTDPREGDLVIGIYCSCTPSGGYSWLENQGQTELCDIQNDVGQYRVARLHIIYKFMGATPDSYWQYYGTQNNLNAQYARYLVYRNVSSVTPIDATFTSSHGEGNAYPDPPSYTPVTPGALVLACTSCTSDLEPVKTMSTNLTDLVYHTDYGLTQSIANGVSKQENWTSGAVDPVIWTGGTSQADDSWQSAVFALRPGTRAIPNYEVALPR